MAALRKTKALCNERASGVITTIFSLAPKKKSSTSGAVVGIASYKMGPEDYSAGFGVSVKELKAFISGQ